MATAIGDLVIRLGAQTTQFDKRMRVARGQVRTMGPATARMGTMMAGGFATATAGVHALTASLMTLVGPFMGVYGAMKLIAGGEQFNRKMRQSMAIMGDLTNIQRDQLQRAAIETARVTVFSATQAAEAFYYLKSAGLSVAQSITALPAVAKFGQAGMFDLARATSLSTDALSALGLKVKDPVQNLTNLTRVMDVLVKANQLADASVEQFSESLTSKAADSARRYNQSLEEVVSILALLAERGTKDRLAGERYAIMMRNLAIKANQNARAFKKYNINVYSSAGAFRFLGDVIADVERAMKGMSTQQRTLLLDQIGFTAKTIDSVGSLIGFSEEIRTFREELGRAGGAMNEVAGRQMTAFQKGWAQLGATFTAAGKGIMDWLGPKLEVAMTRFSNFLRRLPNLFAMMSESAQIAGQMFREHFSGAIDTVIAFTKPLSDAFAEAFTVIADNLDTMMGSWEGFSEGVIHLTKQTTLAVQSLWQKMITGVAIEIEKLPGRIQGAYSWMAEQAPWFFGKDETDAINRLEASRVKTERNTNAVIRELRASHEKKMAALGRSSIREQKRHDENRAKFARLSDPAKLDPDAYRRPGTADSRYQPAAGETAGAGAGGSPGAFARNSREAWSSLMAAMNQRSKPMADVAKNTKKAADELSEIEQLLRDREPERFQEIPD